MNKTIYSIHNWTGYSFDMQLHTDRHSKQWHKIWTVCNKIGRNYSDSERQIYLETEERRQVDKLTVASHTLLKATHTLLSFSETILCEMRWGFYCWCSCTAYKHTVVIQHTWEDTRDTRTITAERGPFSHRGWGDLNTRISRLTPRFGDKETLERRDTVGWVLRRDNTL